MNTPSEPLLDAEQVSRRVEALARTIAPTLDDDWVTVCMLTGAIWFAADLTRALSRLGCNPLFDGLWLASYGDARAAGGGVEVHAGLQRSVLDRSVLLLDEVIDSGATLAAARRLALAAGAAAVSTAVFARKPWPEPRELEPDFVAWEAPARFLAGYGMDLGGRLRGLDHIVALD